MPIPKFDEIVRLIPTVLEQGREYRRRDIVRAVREYLIEKGMVGQKELEERLESGPLRLDNRIEWAIHKLLSQGRLERTRRATYRLLEKNYMGEERLSGHMEEQSPQEQMDEAYKLLTDDLKSRLLDLLKKLPPDKFERVVLELLKKMGYGEPVETKKTRDEGIDGIIKGDKLGIEEIYIQAKRWEEQNVGADTINSFIGALARKGVNAGVIITTSDFTPEAYRAVEEVRSRGTKIVLINGDKLASLMIEYGVGVYTRHTYEIKDVDENFFEEV
ncbi:MAG: restriction endonuclease [Armatimonadota bacterium]|nr:restriction endonuclease [Armatimonadota bacterium]